MVDAVVDLRVERRFSHEISLEEKGKNQLNVPSIGKKESETVERCSRLIAEMTYRREIPRE